MKVKFPTEHEIGKVKEDQVLARECYQAILATKENHTWMIEEEEKEKVETLETIESVDGERTKLMKIGTNLNDLMNKELVQFLKENLDIFKWSHKDMPVIATEVIQHCLNVDPEKKPIQQRQQVFAPKCNRVIMDEVDKFLVASFIQEVYYPDWLAKVILVKKANRKWRMCMNFTDLNSTCPKDSFPLPRIDQLVNSTTGHKLLTFIDAFSSYNQIKMLEEDQEKTAFITSQGLYCYKIMPFGLKNAGATYQKLVNRMFNRQIERNMEVYVNDMLVKSKEEKTHLDNLKETFATLRQYQMRLNPGKCAFGVSLGKFQFMMSQQGIEANPEKIQAILEMTSPKIVKEVQMLTGRIPTLNRFFSKATDRCLPFLQNPEAGFFA